MALICVSSAHGSPGATTLALLAAGCWPRPAVVVEADPAGGVLAVRYGLGRTPGLADLAAAVDTHAPAEALWASAQALPGGLRVVVAPESGDVTVGILDDVAGPLGRWLLKIDEADVIIDCGRTLTGVPTVALMEAASAVLVVARSTADQLYPAAHRVHALAERTGCEHLGLVLVGRRPHRPDEVATQLHVPVLGVVDDDPRTAQAFARGGGAGRALRRSPLVRSVQALVDDLTVRVGLTDVADADAPPAHLQPTGPHLVRSLSETVLSAGERGAGAMTRIWQDLVGGLEVDRASVARLHDEVAPRLNRRVAERQAVDAGTLTFADEKALGRHVVGEVLAEWRAAAYQRGEEPLGVDVEAALARSVHDEIYGLGRVQVFVDHPDVVDVHIPGADSIFMTLTDGSKIRGPSVVDSDAELNALVSRQARRAGRSERRFDREEVDLDLRLPNGARLHALREVTGRTVVDIRQHRWEIGWLDQLVECDEIDTALAGFLVAAVRARFNIVVAGGTAAGKTTMLRCLINEIPPGERVITVEDSLELGIERFADLHPDHESIEARKPNSEGKGAFTLSDALRSSLRMMDSAGGRVIVGEVRGYEVIPMLKAMTQGNDGSMCTVHGSSARDALGRLQLYALEAPEHLSHEVSAPYIAAGVHFVAYLEPRDGIRRVRSVIEISHADGAAIAVNEIWKPDFAGRAIPGARLREETEQRLADAGFDLSLLDKPNGWWRR